MVRGLGRSESGYRDCGHGCLSPPVRLFPLVFPWRQSGSPIRQFRGGLKWGGRVAVRGAVSLGPELLPAFLVAMSLLATSAGVTVGLVWIWWTSEPLPRAKGAGAAGAVAQCGRSINRFTGASVSEGVLCAVFVGAIVIVVWASRSGVPDWMLLVAWMQATLGLLVLAWLWNRASSRTADGSWNRMAWLQSRLAVLALGGAGASVALVLAAGIMVAWRPPPWQGLLVTRWHSGGVGMFESVTYFRAASGVRGLVAPGLLGLGEVAAMVGLTAAVCWLFGWLRAGCGGAVKADATWRCNAMAPCGHEHVVALLSWAGISLAVAVGVIFVFERRLYWGPDVELLNLPALFGQVVVSMLVLLAEPFGIVWPKSEFR